MFKFGKKKDKAAAAEAEVPAVVEGEGPVDDAAPN